MENKEKWKMQKKVKILKEEIQNTFNLKEEKKKYMGILEEKKTEIWKQ